MNYDSKLYLLRDEKMAVTMQEAYSTILDEKVSTQEVDKLANKHLKKANPLD